MQILLQKTLPDAVELATLQGYFEVVSAPTLKSNGMAFNAKTISLVCEKPSKRWPAEKQSYRQACDDLHGWKNTVLLTAYNTKSSLISSTEISTPLSDHSALNVGDFIHAKVRLRRPRGLVNRGLFDYETWLLSQGIYAKGYILPSTLVINKKSGWGFGSLRSYFNEHINSAENIHFRPLFKALLLGDKTEITPEQWQVLQQTGTLHLMAISGLHIGLAAWLGFMLSRLCIKLNVRVFWQITGRFYWCSAFRLLPYGVSVITAYFYAGLAGFSVPTLRALIMVCTVNMCFILARRVSLYRIFFLAALIIVVLDPFVFLATGFWLSFGAVFVLLLVYKPDTVYVGGEGIRGRIYAAKRYFILLNKMQWILFLGLLFPVLFFTGKVSWIAPFANMFMVPLISFVIVPMLFLIAVLFIVAPVMANNLLALSDTIMEFAWSLLAYLALLQNMITRYVFFDSFPLLAIILGCMAVACCFVFKPIGVRLASLGLIFALLLSRPNPSPHFRLSVLDVGQGLSVVIAYKNHVLLYDTGAYFSPTFDMGKNIIAPSLHHSNVREIDMLVISHSDNDHKGGAASLLNLFPVERLLVSKADIELTLQELLPNKAAHLRTHKKNDASSKPKIDICVRNTPRAQVSADDGVTSMFKITALWPTNNKKYADLLVSTNNRSCVLLVEVDGLSILLTGDVDRKVEQVLVDLGLPEVDILIAAHHGSKTSSSSAFIDALAPSAVIFSSGYKNKYGHPHPLVVNKYTQRNIKTFNTALDGEVYLLYDINKPYHVNHIQTARSQSDLLR